MKLSKRVKLTNKQLSAILEQDNLAKHSDALLPLLKQYIEVSNNYLKTEFKKATNIRSLVHARSRHIDRLLIALWHHLKIDNSIALIAVGGYGRGELHPHSDIDLLILNGANLSDEQKKLIELMISLLWDCRLKVGQAVRDLEQCVEIAKQDLTVTTNIMESRFLAGNKDLFQQLQNATTPEKLWDAQSFFEAKTHEQKARYKKYNSTSFDLEPNVKTSPGGLRDIHLIGWIAQRFYYPKTLYQLIKQNFIFKNEYYTLVKCQLYIWKVRFALHIVSDKAEDRLLFDYQKSAAKLMGYQDTKNSLAVEKMMKQYYRSALVIRNICDILLQILEEELAVKSQEPEIVPINENYQIVNQRIDVIDHKLFLRDPSQLLKIFHHVAKNNSLKGITASSLRAIRSARHKINNSFRSKKNNKVLFVEFWHILHTSSRAMFLMKKSGVLADYLEPFKRITGQMQYDMFHNYTVDEHTLFLLENLSKFADPEHNHAFPICSEIMQRQQNPEIIFLAGLFHDIAKGRGGDHSELGAVEARQFCIRHKIPTEHASLVEWLVGNHLFMSLIAQKRDISDPKVIQNFAKFVQTQQRLELLYILTVADIRATSHSLWNSWKDSLLKNLYISTCNYLNQDIETNEKIEEQNQLKAKEKLISLGINPTEIEQLWQPLDPQYFAKHSISAIVWRTKIILETLAKNEQDTNRSTNDIVVVGIRSTFQQGGSEIFVYSKDQDNLFAALTATLNRLGLSIQAANIYTDKSGYCYDSFIVLDDKGQILNSQLLKQNIKQAIIKNMGNINNMNLSVQKRMPRQFKYFSIPTEVEFFDDEYMGFTRMELIARDQAGLLAAIGKAFMLTKTRLHDARISTLGEKVEDTFIISNRDNSPIADEQQRERIRNEIKRQLNK
ncbi:[protein-PII] uridylyltransferase [Aliikangiella sp. IMCC44359]|uniref:[protein-PII] uridylyltransferase n=1 Tax=Aliikangiella sp. IMCC44359 TaxID=3459125 RepID=UPI00403AC7A6